MQQANTFAWSRSDREYIPVYLAPLLAMLLVAASFMVQGRVGLNLADEGYLWHGVIRVLNGDVPILDFQSYDPGRYYWSALWMRLFGSDGIVALRLSVALFQACGLAAGLLLLRRVIGDPLALSLASVVLLLWFFPRHKYFDLSFSLFAVYVGAYFIARPTLSRHFAAGLYVGAAAVFGRNHGVYAAIALSGLAILAWARIDRTRAASKLLMLGAGTVIGYSPMFLLALTQPGFFQAMVDSVLLMLRVGSTNLQIPVPWPWTVAYDVAPAWALHRLLVGLAFMAMPAFYVAALLVLVRKIRSQSITRNSVLVSAIAVGIAYMHYAFARADVGHLAHAIFPFLLAILSLPATLPSGSARMTLAVSGALLVVSIFAAGMMSPLYLNVWAQAPVEIEIRGDTLTVDADTARSVRTVQMMAEQHMRPGERVVFAPYWPTMYGVIGQISPTFETYSVWNDIQGQQRFIEDLERARVPWAVIGNPLLDGRLDRRFSSTHPMVWRYLGEHYEAIQTQGLPSDYRLLRRRTSGDSRQ